MKRTVPDTNILVSAVQFGGLPAEFLDLAGRRAFQALTSPALLDELEETLRRKFGWSAQRTQELRAKLLESMETISTNETITFVQADPDDDRVLECAIAGRADYIVSGDKHLLNLGQFEGIPILRLREFLDILHPPA